MRIDLTINKRQDDETFFNMLNEIRVGEISEVSNLLLNKMSKTKIDMKNCM